MPEFLTVWDAILSAAAVLVIFILYRVVQRVIQTDMYLNWVHLIKPALVIISVLVLVVSVRKTERIWNNLAYINNYPVRTLMLDWPTVNTPDTSQTRAMDIYLEQRKAWPVALVGQPRVADSIPINISGLSPNDFQATLIQKDTVYWDAVDDTLYRKPSRKMSFDSLANFTYALDTQLLQLQDSVLFKNSPYMLKIDTWIVSDSISVRLGDKPVVESEK